ncbi:MAG TPA: hypothetical protein VK279_09350, partial [Solirubrobacteraceae bacterium]|nr:hypothetical protein [Solirubrobacteraceae bacterium]
RRADQGAYMLPGGLRDVVGALDGRRGGVYVEGAGQEPQAPLSMPATYHVVNEETGQRLGITVEADDFNGLAFLGGVRRAGREFSPAYQWVVTRLAGIRTDRKVVARSGPYAVERVRGPLDITVVSGVTADPERRDESGRAWVEGVMTFWVTARRPGPASARLTFRGPAAGQATVKRPGSARVVGRSREALTLCVPVSGRESLRRLTVELDFPGAPRTGPTAEFDETFVPGKALALSAMRASPGGC